MKINYYSDERIAIDSIYGTRNALLRVWYLSEVEFGAETSD